MVKIFFIYLTFYNKTKIIRYGSFQFKSKKFAVTAIITLMMKKIIRREE